MSQKNFEYVKSLDQKGLKDFYECYHHHNHHRHNHESCKSALTRSQNNLCICSRDVFCPCTCQNDHFCTALDPNLPINQSAEFITDSRFPICEHYKYFISLNIFSQI